MSRSSEFLGVSLMPTFLRNHRISCLPTLYPAHSLVSLNNVVPSNSCTDHHKGSLNLMTSYLMKGGPLHAKSASFSNLTPTTHFSHLPHLLHLPHLFLPHLPHLLCLTPNVLHILLFLTTTHATVYHPTVTAQISLTLRLLSQRHTIR